GWNIISNPFEKPVSLADIRNANALPNAIIHAFSGGFTQPTTMAPYEGYYFLNPDERGSLSIPYPFGTSLPKTNEEPYFLSEKNLKLNLSSGEFSSDVKIGFDETANNNYDVKDYFAPPGNFEEVGIRLVNNDFSTNYKQLFIEHRKEIGEGQSFEIQIKNITNKKANLIVSGIEKFTEQEIYLVDERLKKFYNLKTQNQIEISGSHQNSKYSLLIGNEDFIKIYKENYSPTEFALYQNYPNPFNPTTFIRYQVPEKEHVSIRVYDILGNLVKILVDEIKEEGYYETQFDGSGLSSGIYIYKFESGSVSSIKKMTLLK
ncbi:MAG TPA: T9SS type A sorting domain-containing protein, partial [Ignavibacteriaceae bacterium]|nr:T9SS type A sorting domain-containing protein [Ignavibacteriaceae bacterium]